MYFAYSLGIFILTTLAANLMLRYLRKNERTTCGVYLLAYLLVGLVPFILMTLITLISSWVYFDGLCFSAWECTFWEYLGGELEYSIILFLPALGLSIVAVMLMTVFHWFFTRRGVFKTDEEEHDVIP